jgi:hypothetical protein
MRRQISLGADVPVLRQGQAIAANRPAAVQRQDSSTFSGLYLLEGVPGDGVRGCCYGGLGGSPGVA